VSVKFQVTLPDDLALALKQAAARDRVPPAEYIRAAMAEQLNRQSHTDSVDPFASITDIGGEQDTDLAARVDEILYE
jgi:hypothetical protein